MIDYGASNFVMPKCVAELLGIKYEPMVRDVLQLDGRSVKIVRILKNVDMSLHACPGCTVISS